MKKVYLLLAALVCALVCMIGLNLHAKTLLDDNIEKAIYYNNVSSKLEYAAMCKGTGRLYQISKYSL